MQITIQKLSHKEREAFFRKNKWLIHRLLGIQVMFPNWNSKDDQQDVDSPNILQKYAKQQHGLQNFISSQEEELKEKFEDAKEIKEALEDIEEKLGELITELGEEEKAFVEEELGDTIDELQEELTEDNNASSKNDSDITDNLEEEKAFVEELGDTIDELQEELTEDNNASSKNDSDITDNLEEEKNFVEELENAIDELQEELTEENNASSESDSDQPDDLTRINGLGPKTAEGLLEAGITSFKQIAELSEQEIEALDEEIRNFAKSYERKRFRKQAKDLL